MPHVENDRIVETPTEARGAVTGHNVRHVLVYSLFGVMLAFFVLYLYYFI
jgi:hypothetical protein